MNNFVRRFVTIFLFGIVIGFNLSEQSTFNSNFNQKSLVIINSLRGGAKKYPNNFNKNFHRVLRTSFPDSKTRIEFENYQRGFYQSACLKLSLSKNLTPKQQRKLLTIDEQDALNYVNGQGFYSVQQNFRKKPNKFDTRESFLIKMHNESTRTRFLKSSDRI